MKFIHSLYLATALSVASMGSVMAQSASGQFTHTVSKGQSLYSISAMYNVSIEDIVRLNPGSEKSIRAGQVLNIPQKGNGGQVKFHDCYKNAVDVTTYEEAKKILLTPMGKGFFYSKKLNALLDINVIAFNHAVFAYLKQYTEYPVGKLDYFPLIDNDDVLGKEDIFRILEESGVGVPAYYNLIDFEVDGKKGQYCRSRSGCYFCFFQQKIEWIWLYEQHPDLFEKAMSYEKDGYTWIQGEPLSDLIKPERVRQIKLDHIKKTEAAVEKAKSSLLIDLLDDDDINCANCFI